MLFRRRNFDPISQGCTFLVRFLLSRSFLAVFNIAAEPFWLNNQSRIGQYSEEAPVKDLARMLNDSDRRLIKNTRKALLEECHDLNLRLSLAPTTDAKNLYPVLDP